MQELVNQIFNWPNIIQAVIGSALFAVIWYLASSIVRFIIKHSLSFSKKARRESLINERLRYTAVLSERTDFSTVAITTLIYVACSFFFKGISALVLGYLLGYLSPMFKYIGCVFSLYYLFFAIDTVRDVHSQDKEELKEKLTEIETQIKKIDDEA